MNTITEIKLVQKDIAEFDNKIVEFMAKNNLPGITLAVSERGKLIYQKGYGIVNKETGEKVNANHRFRVGSMSKTVSAIAILKLVQDGKVKLEDKVFGAGAIFGNTYGTKVYFEDFKNITVRNFSGKNFLYYLNDDLFKDIGLQNKILYQISNCKKKLKVPK